MLIFLVGLSGSGKSTVGPLLARRLGVPFRDTDDEIEHRAGRSVAEIFETEGEPAFRTLERAAIAEVCSMPVGVVATGGGALTDSQNREAMTRTGKIVWLDAPSSVLTDRLAGQGNTARPLLGTDPLTALERLRGQREATYAAWGARIDTAGRNPAEVVDEILGTLEAATPSPPPSPAGGEGVLASPLAGEAGQRSGPGEGARPRGTSTTRRSSDPPDVVWVRTSAPYPVYVGHGLLEQAGRILKAQGLDTRLHVIADEKVFDVHGPALERGLAGMACHWYPVPGNEEHKTLDQAGRLYDGLLQKKPERQDIVVAFGGGVIGDLAGFVAATLLRGLRFVQLPTTLLAQVDSSVGGKVGVDHVRGKNLIGAFHQPSLVLADIDTLRTLPARQVANGWAEVVKIAVVQDAVLFQELEESAERLRSLEAHGTQRAIRRAVELKARLVEQDERDLLGSRALLNYGHTLGHALEAATSYQRFLHGEAIAIGMAAAAPMAHWLGLHPQDAVQRQTRLLETLGLPQRCPGVSKGDLRQAMGLDKKRAGGIVTWILPTGLGAARSGVAVPEEIVERAIDLVTSGAGERLPSQKSPPPGRGRAREGVLPRPRPIDDQVHSEQPGTPPTPTLPSALRSPRRFAAADRKGGGGRLAHRSSPFVAKPLPGSGGGVPSP